MSKTVKSNRFNPNLTLGTSIRVIEFTPFERQFECLIKGLGCSEQAFMKLRVSHMAIERLSRAKCSVFARFVLFSSFLFAVSGCVGGVGPAQIGIGASPGETQPAFISIDNQDENASFVPQKSGGGSVPPVPSKPLENSGGGIQLATAAPAKVASNGQVAEPLAVSQSPRKAPAENVINAAIQKPTESGASSNPGLGQENELASSSAIPASRAAKSTPALNNPIQQENNPASVQVASAAQLSTTASGTQTLSLDANPAPAAITVPAIKKPKRKTIAARRGRDEGGTVPRPVKKVKRATVKRISEAHDSAKSTENKSRKRPKEVVLAARQRSNTEALPGVRSTTTLFGIRRSEPKKERSDRSQQAGKTRLAALAGAGRLSPNGVRVQHSKVQVHCLKPAVLGILKTVERRYGSKPIVTSGYRSPQRNRRAGGARNSQHIYCNAVDIQVEGVSKWDLAKYLRSIPGRGGVGTYCRTKSVHVDIGKKRDWHHPCRRSSVKKRKKRRI